LRSANFAYAEPINVNLVTTAVEIHFELFPDGAPVTVGCFFAEAQMPFSDAGSIVSRPFHHIGDGRLIGINDESYF